MCKRHKLQTKSLQFFKKKKKRLSCTSNHLLGKTAFALQTNFKAAKEALIFHKARAQ